MRTKKEKSVNTKVTEIRLSDEDWAEFSHGIDLFNEGKFWHAHEAWDEVMKRHAESGRSFFQGLLQMATAYHHLMLKKSFRGVVHHFEKALSFLTAFPSMYLGIDVRNVLITLEAVQKEAETIGSAHLEKLNPSCIAKIQFQKPPDPDLQARVCGFLESEQFLEGARMFNTGYYWDAHECWEELKRDVEEEAKSFADAFSQMALGCHFLKQRKYPNAVYLFGKVLDYFKSFEQQTCEYPLARLIEDIQAQRSKLSGGRIVEGNGQAILTVPLPQLKKNEP